MLYHIALLTHITGLAMVAGTTLVDYALFRQFWKHFVNDRSRACALQEGIARVQLFVGIGILLLILSGVGMMAATSGVFGEQLWFRVKFGLVLVIVLNGVLVGRRLIAKAGKLASGEASEAELTKTRSSINLFHLVQLLCFMVVFTLSVFRFN